MIKAKMKEILMDYTTIYSFLIKIRRVLIGFKSYCLFLIYFLLNKLSKSKGIISSKREVPLVISLTTFPKRINNIYLVIESLFRQTIKPDRIILWLTREEFPNGEKGLPQRLLTLKERGLEIKFSNKNLRSYNKLLWSLKLCPTSLIVTVDDDVFYEKKMLEGLYKKHIKFPKEIICYTSHLIEKESSEKLKNYEQRVYNFLEKVETPRSNFMAEGVAGVLYPPNSLSKEVFNEDNIKKLAPLADDIWFKAMALKKGTKYVRAVFNENKPVIEVPGSQKEGLYRLNQIENRNDKQLKDVFNYYKLYKKLKD